MTAALTFVLLLCFWGIWSQPTPFSVVFSAGTQLIVEEGNLDHLHHHGNKTRDSGPSIQTLSSVPFSQGPGSPPVLVCILTELTSPRQDVLWWIDDTVVTSPDVALWRSEGGGAYSATSAWKVSAANWRTRSRYWCGTIQHGQVFRQSVCPGD
ncbi:secreted immunoglobulin domain 1 isoform X1 [Antennarius striatus]|uniref:secreted immunoglobulin domain 1 isoform X1 n=1 Tax=Antennarius striatus TaxID=241820 RepID=UPI0035B4D4AC